MKVGGGEPLYNELAEPHGPHLIAILFRVGGPVALVFTVGWFGILFCVNMQVNFLSPPFGPAAFHLKGVAPPEISLGDIFASLVPFIAMRSIVPALVLFFPDIALWPLKP